MKQSMLLEFESTAFKIEPGEDEQTNPGIFGKALAHWMAEQLRARGVGAGEVIPEDFGWCVRIESRPHSLYVVCASADTEINHWRVFGFAEGGLISRLLGQDTSAQSIAMLYKTLKDTLQDSPLIYNLREEAA